MTFDMHSVTFTDSDGEEVNAFDYLVEEGNLAVPGGRYGTDTFDCAAVACLLHEIYVYCNGPDNDTVEGLEGCMSLVVNSADDVAYLIREYAGLVGADPADYLDEYDLNAGAASW